MEIEVLEASAETLAAHGAVPIAFTVRSRLAVAALGSGGGEADLVEVPVESPYVKDYDAVGDGGPACWAARWDLTRWGVLGARADGRRIGGAVVAWNTPDLEMLEGRQDLAVVWDLRVEPGWRRRGVGARLWNRAALWARERGCRTLRAETQDVNVPACRFYASRGCVLRHVDSRAYPGLPDETMLLWELDLWTRAGTSADSGLPVSGRWGIEPSTYPPRFPTGHAEDVCG